MDVAGRRRQWRQLFVLAYINVEKTDRKGGNPTRHIPTYRGQLAACTVRARRLEL